MLNQPRLLAVLGLTVILGQACGLRQFNGRLRNNSQASTQAAAPFYSAGQGGNSMSPSTCNSLSGRPCIRARASVGLPYRFDVNPNDSNGIAVGTTYPVAPAPYAGTAGVTGPTGNGAGRTLGTGTQDKRGSNYDLSILQRQTSSGDYAF